MTRSHILVASTTILLAACLVETQAAAAPQPMTRTEIIDVAKSGMGYSYWWGGGAWRSDGTQHGSCSGNCPSCTHSGSYGADCSGFAAKVWQVPSPTPLTTNSHPYSTSSFYNNTTHWKKIAWKDAKKADAFVHNNGTSGHIVIYEKGDPWGSSWVYECKGCSYGCVHDLKKLTSDYEAIRRDLVEEDPVPTPDAGPKPEAGPGPEPGPETGAPEAAVNDAHSEAADARDVSTEPHNDAHAAAEASPTVEASVDSPTGGGALYNASPTDDTGGCGCRAAGRGAKGSARGPALMLLLALAALRRFRQTTTAAPRSHVGC